MTFLNPFFLWGLPVVFAPLVLHFIFKRPPKRVPFSYVAWIRGTHSTFVAKRKLKDWILLIIRTLFLAALVFFFARPVWYRGALPGGEAEDISLLILMDVSASMSGNDDGRNYFDVARQAVRSLLRELPVSAKIGVLAFSDRTEAELTPTGEKPKVSTFLDELKPTSRPTDVLPTLKEAMAILSNQNSKKKMMIVVSDFAKPGWAIAVRENGQWSGYDPDVSVIAWETVGPPRSNMGFSNAVLQLSRAGSLTGFARVHWSGKSATDRKWSMELNQKTISQGIVERRGNGIMEMPIQARLPEGGKYSGVLTLDPDPLNCDNTFYLAGRIPEGFRLLIVDGDSGLAPSDSESYYLKLAMDSPRDPRVESIDTVRPESLPSVTLSEYDVIVLANVRLPATMTDPMLQWVEAGGGLFMTAGASWLSPVRSPLGILPLKNDSQITQSVENPQPDLPFIEEIIGAESFQWDQIDVDRHLRAEISDDFGTSLIRLKNGDPLLVQKPWGKGQLLWLLTTIDRAWTNFPAKPVYAPFVRESIATLADPLRSQTTLMGEVGAPMEVALHNQVTHATVVNPDGTSRGIDVRDGLLRIPAPESAGLYQVKTNNGEFDFDVAINIPNLHEEGSIERITISDLKTAFPRSSVDLIVSHDGSPASIMPSLQGIDMTKVLIVLALVLLVVETGLMIWVQRGGAVARKATAAIVVLGILCGSVIGATASEGGSDFVYAQLKYDGNWDPYPRVYEQILNTVGSMTNIPHVREKAVVTLSGPDLFAHPFLVVQGNSGFSPTEVEKKNLKLFIDRGGFVFFDDTLGEPDGPFGKSVRALLAEMYPDRPLARLSMDHSVFRSFFLLRTVAGRRVSRSYLEGLDVGGRLGGEGRTAVVYSPNDVLGAWVRDNLGKYVYACEPGGERQRWEAMKLTINIIYFSLTGTYKRDAIHQPFIERKLGP